MGFLDFRTLGISSNSQASGLAVPDASMHPVQSSSDVMNFMEIGLKNRAKSSTAMNERSSRSHRFFLQILGFYPHSSVPYMFLISLHV